jgi:hypothetical protein
MIASGWLIAHDTLVDRVALLPAVLVMPHKPKLDKAAYDRQLRHLANVSESATDTSELLWPVRAAYPNLGALLPFKRIIAYYGNFSAKGMGVLGEYPEDEMLEMFRKEMKAWADADPSTPVMPAVDYIAITAQQAAGKDGAYRLRMSSTHIDRALEVAEKIDGIVILEVQPGKANLMAEIRSLEPYLSMPLVHLAIDPEFRMKHGQPPGTAVGTVDAADVNDAAAYLAGLVQANHLPPKVLIVHRYTSSMVTRATSIEPLPEVQVVIDMDGWGPADRKYSTYNSYIHPEPVQFTGFKLFYKNDIKREGSRLLKPEEVLKLTPQPSFIQYQ